MAGSASTRYSARWLFEAILSSVAVMGFVAGFVLIERPTDLSVAGMAGVAYMQCIAHFMALGYNMSQSYSSSRPNMARLWYHADILSVGFCLVAITSVLLRYPAGMVIVTGCVVSIVMLVISCVLALLRIRLSSNGGQ